MKSKHNEPSLFGNDYFQEEYSPIIELDKNNIEITEEEDEEEEIINSNSLLKGTRFYLMGKFTNKKSALMKRIIDLGGSTKSGLAKKTQAIIVGDSPNEREMLKLDMLNHDGFSFPEINEQQLVEILDGVNKDFCFPEVIKNVNITYDFIFNSKHPKIVVISNDGITHFLGEREIFVHSVEGDELLFWQIIGNLAGYATNLFDPLTANYIMLNDRSIEHLKLGVKDELIELVANTYNSSKSDKFTYKFILEREFMEFVKSRSAKVNDVITLNLLHKYEKC